MLDGVIRPREEPSASSGTRQYPSNWQSHPQVPALGGWLGVDALGDAFSRAEEAV
jgi:hypothetical protein